MLLLYLKSIKLVHIPEYIYIPLCFYFISISTFFTVTAQQFTFHYASTLSIPRGCESARIPPFTFHYASTLSNVSSGRQYDRAIFTFHYASTLSLSFLAFVPPLRIYIPLCFYFIFSVQFHWADVLQIYIPLCFYFIAFDKNTRMLYIKFTFHYASTLSDDAFNQVKQMMKFTFHYASTLSQMSSTQLPLTQSIYIPLCFYFIHCVITSVRK